MRLLIVRHADPDYSIDSLTPAGWEEAKLLADRLAPVPVAAYYVSPLGRAKDTASLTLKKACRTAARQKPADGCVNLLPRRYIRERIPGIVSGTGCRMRGWRSRSILIKITGMKQKSFRTPM